MIGLIIFWVAVVLIVYTYIGFPLGVVLRGLLWGRPYEHYELTHCTLCQHCDFRLQRGEIHWRQVGKHLVDGVSAGMS
jgi:hypothetical protein